MLSPVSILSILTYISFYYLFINDHQLYRSFYSISDAPQTLTFEGVGVIKLSQAEKTRASQAEVLERVFEMKGSQTYNDFMRYFLFLSPTYIANMTIYFERSIFAHIFSLLPNDLPFKTFRFPLPPLHFFRKFPPFPHLPFFFVVA